MVKYGKQYREYQIEEWRTHYINYKALKQKIKQIKTKLPKENQPSNVLFGVSNINPMPLIPDNSGSTEDQNLAPLFKSKYGKYLKEFVDLLNEQFHKFYVFFSNTEKQLYQEINTHLYARENYHKFNRKQIKNELNSLGVSIYLAKCLNCFINDNLTAVKKILKKFDKNFMDYFGLIAPRYILSQISSSSNDLDYIIQFKIIDEASCVCEENANILKELYLKIEDHPNNNNHDIENQNDNIPEIQVDFMQQYKELLMCVREIDEIIDFKIQYKEWFSFVKKGNKLLKNNPTLLENDIFNPLLSSTNYKDSLIEKFLSTNKAFYEIEDVQISVSDLNERNMKLILVHKFFYNSLITSIIPILYFFTETENKNNQPGLSYFYMIIILSIAYLSSYMSLFFFKHPGTKAMLLISYSLFFTGSLFHIISCNYYFNKKDNLPRFLYLIISRIFIGIGSMEIIGRKYIVLYSPRFYLIKISKNYSLYNFLGYAAGPFVSLLLLLIDKYLIEKNEDYTTYISYNKFNCVGWYGVCVSFILFCVHLILFTRQNADDFQMIRNENNLNFAIKTSFHSERDSRKAKAKKKFNKRRSKILDDDNIIITKSDILEGWVPESEDDEEKKSEKKEEEKKEEEKKEEEKKEEEKKEEDKKEENKKEEEKKEDEILNINKIEDELGKNKPKKTKKKLDVDNLEKISSSAKDLVRIDIGSPADLSICSNNLDTGLNSSQILSTKQKKMINRIESKLDEFNEKSNFTNINMIPKAIDQLIIKERTTFGYLKSNILVMLLLLFFSNILKASMIVSSTYYLFKNKAFVDEEYIAEIICGILTCYYLLQLLSLYFVLPLRKINVFMKKYLIIFMLATIIFISPLLYSPILESNYLILGISSGAILLSTIISILASCYMAYLLPPGWKIFFIHAGRLPSCLIVFGKVVGILLNLIENYRIYTIFSIISLCYISIIIYLFITNNFRIKVIARIMRKKIFENIGI